MKGIFTLLLILMSPFMVVGNEEFVTRVVNVIDGNTIEVIGTDSQVQKIVLAGIDSPEPGQPFSENATKKLQKLLQDKEVKVLMQGKNRWGNYLAVVTILKTGEDPRIELLEEGLAWTAEKNPIPELEEVRLKAESKARGLWKDQDRKAPWIYRREQTMLQAKSS